MPAILIIALFALVSSALGASAACLLTHRQRERKIAETQRALDRLSSELGLERVRIGQLEASLASLPDAGPRWLEPELRRPTQRPERLAEPRVTGTDSAPLRA